MHRGGGRGRWDSVIGGGLRPPKNGNGQAICPPMHPTPPPHNATAHALQLPLLSSLPYISLPAQPTPSPPFWEA